MFTALYLPLNIAFNTSMSDTSAIDLLTNILFGIDILLNFLTCYYDKNDDLITNRIVLTRYIYTFIKQIYLLNYFDIIKNLK